MADSPDQSTDVLDLPTLEEASGGDLELMRELADLYVTDCDNRIPELEQQVASGEAVAAGRIAHGLKGSSASIGAGRAARAFERIEALGRSGEATGLRDALAAARSAYEHTRNALRAWAA